MNCGHKSNPKFTEKPNFHLAASRGIPQSGCRVKAQQIINMNTETNAEIIEKWLVKTKTGETLGEGPTPNKAWRMVGATNERERKELMNHGFKVVKQ